MSTKQMQKLHYVLSQIHVIIFHQIVHEDQVCIYFLCRGDALIHKPRPWVSSKTEYVSDTRALLFPPKFKIFEL